MLAMLPVPVLGMPTRIVSGRAPSDSKSSGLSMAGTDDDRDGHDKGARRTRKSRLFEIIV